MYTCAWANACTKSELDHSLYFVLHCTGLKSESTNTAICGAILLRVFMWVLRLTECAFQRKLNKSYFLPALSLSLSVFHLIFFIHTSSWSFFSAIFGLTECIFAPQHFFWKRKEGFSLSHLWTTFDVCTLVTLNHF